MTLNTLLAAGFTGTNVPVHPTAAEIAGLTAYHRVSDIPVAVDLAVIVVPAAEVPAAVDDCIAKGFVRSASSVRGSANAMRRGARAKPCWWRRSGGQGVV